jgi:hypothetical protein
MMRNKENALLDVWSIMIMQLLPVVNNIHMEVVYEMMSF